VKTKDKMGLKSYKETKAHLQKAERQSYWKYINNIIEIGDPDQEDRPPKQKRFWSYIKSLRKDTNGIAPLEDAGILHADTKDKADILNQQDVVDVLPV
jgi:hypothetical protein